MGKDAVGGAGVDGVCNVFFFHFQFLVLGLKQGSFMICTIALWMREISWRGRFVCMLHLFTT